jgi:hypothetical protein
VECGETGEEDPDRDTGPAAGCMSRGGDVRGSCAGAVVGPWHARRGNRRSTRPSWAGAGSSHWPSASASQPELGTNTVSLRAPNRSLSGSVAFLGHLGQEPAQLGSPMNPRVHYLSPGPGPAGFYFWGGTRAGFSTNRRGGYPPSQPRKNQPGTSL